MSNLRGQLHVGAQNVDELNLRRFKAHKRGKQDSDAHIEDDSNNMNETTTRVSAAVNENDNQEAEAEQSSSSHRRKRRRTAKDNSELDGSKQETDI